MEWNDATVDKLREWYAAGKPCRLIAAELGMTKNMVIGKARRLGLWHPNGAAPVQIYHPPYRKIETPDYAHCQFPTGNVGEAGFHFCGDTAKIGSAYCEEHHTRCHRDRRDREDGYGHSSKSPFNRFYSYFPIKQE